MSEFAPGSTSPTDTLTDPNGSPYALAFDGNGNLHVANSDGRTVSEFVPGSTTPSATLTGLNGPLALAFDSSGDLYVANSANNTVSEFTPASVASPTAGGVVIRSSLGSWPMSLGGTSNAVTGINLTDTELAQIRTTPTGTVTIGDSTQTGNITFTTATPATTAGASTVVVQAAGGAGQIRLDDASGTGTALNGNGGSISLIAGRGGIQAQSAPNTAAEIGGATSVKLYSSGGIGTSEPLQLAPTTLTTNSSGDQRLSALGTVTAISMNAGSGAIELLGGTLVASGSVSCRGGTFVTGGTLVVTASSALPSGSSLTVGAGGSSAFGGTATAAMESSASSPAATGGSSAASDLNEWYPLVVHCVYGRGDYALTPCPSPKYGRGKLFLDAQAAQGSAAIMASPGVVASPAGGEHLSRQVENRSLRRAENPSYGAMAQAHDAVLQSLDTRPSVAEAEAAALWDLDNRWSSGQSDRKHDSLDSAVDAVIAMLARM